MALSRVSKNAGSLILRILQVLLFSAFLSGIYFLSAGSLKPAWGYLFFLIYFAFNLAMVLSAGEELLRERQAFHADSARWDRSLSLTAILALIGILVVGGLDWRYGWSPLLPPWVNLLSAGIMLASLAFNTWAVRSNPFYSNVVRIQSERGHRVIDQGPYAMLRHPTYAMGLVLHIVQPLLFGSLWALIPGTLGSIGLIVRTSLEDQTLKSGLPGYDEYTQRVRYRLIPGIW